MCEFVSSGNVDNWFWTFEGGTPSSSEEQNPLISYDVPGTYPVSLTVSNEAGSDNITIEDYIVVNTIPTSNFTFDVNGNIVTFDNLSLNADTYLWTFGPAFTSDLEEPAVSLPQDGTYEVSLLAINGCGADEITLTITITAFPNAGISSSSNIGCEPFDVQFFDNSTDNATAWNWSFPGGSPGISSEQNPVISYLEPGLYTVSLEVSNEVGTNSITLVDYVEVKPLPEALYDFNIDNADVIFSNNSSQYDNVMWDFGDGNVSEEFNPTHTYTSSGDFVVVLIASNECGSDTFEQIIAMDIRTPVIVFSQSVNEGCAPLMVQFVDQSDNDPFSWKWTFPGGNPENSTEQNPLVEYVDPGVYDVSIELTNDFGSSSLTVLGAIVVLSKPLAEFEFAMDQGDVQFMNISDFGESFNWDFGDGSTSNIENPIHTYIESGSFDVVLVVTNKCGNDTIIQTVEIVLSSVFDSEILTLFSVYPNPNNGLFILEIEGSPSKFIEVNLIDLLGRVILDTEVEFISGKLYKTFDLKDIESGSFILQVILDGKRMIRKLVIQK